MRKILSLAIVPAVLGALLASCCEPGHRNSQPLSVDSMFGESVVHDLDVYQTNITGVTDSGYYPVWTFGIKNTGTDDDIFTMRIVYEIGGVGPSTEIDITKHVPGGQVVLFRTPTLPPDSSATYAFPNRTSAADTNLPLSWDYLGFLQQSPDSTEIHFMRPGITISYGAIDNGPEACNTPASTFSLNIDRLPRR